MGKHKFKLSDLIPNSWLYKLKDMNKPPKNHNSFTNKRNQPKLQAISTPKPLPLPNSQSYLPNRASVYLSTKERDDVDKFPVKINPKAIDIHFPTETSKKINQNPRKLLMQPPVASTPILSPPYDRDVYTEEDKLNNFDMLSEIQASPEIKLRPIKTKGLERDAFGDPPSSPRLRSRRLRVYQTRNPLVKGFVVVKSSVNPLMDFRESVMEMIEENGIREAKDFEELLACYLVLNSSEYHAVIIKVFKQIWVDLGFH
ncbi:transcription repressor [Rhynchospora pubera]|uniref:Transcription repressor n=1 Tax=Rhynchospora pubera TaxID=906938 RepID=A0AAV8E1B4_9POAL|nr:transcription repressor [Rhynchospora pubera]